jgi:hypothetical protein
MPTISPEASDWYSGATLERSLAPALDVLRTVTEVAWSAEHTGAGCFWIVHYLTDALWEGPYLVLTSAEGPLAGDDTVHDIEYGGGGWMFIEYDGRTDDHSPNGDGDYTYHGPYATEEMPLRARDLIDQLAP